VQYAQVRVGTTAIPILLVGQRPRVTWRAIRYRIKSQRCGMHTYPERFTDKRGKAMWDKITELHNRYVHPREMLNR